MKILQKYFLLGIVFRTIWKKVLTNFIQSSFENISFLCCIPECKFIFTPFINQRTFHVCNFSRSFEENVRDYRCVKGTTIITGLHVVQATKVLTHIFFCMFLMRRRMEKSGL